MPKVLKLKNISFMLIVFVGLYSLVAYLFYGSIGKSDSSLNLLVQPKQLVFGTIINDSHTFEFQLDEIGVALMMFTVDGFDASEFSQIELSVQHLPKNYQTNLVFISSEEKTPIEIPLLQPNGKNLTNVLSVLEKWQGKINQIGLRFMPHENLGLALPNINPIQIAQINLNNHGFFHNYFTLMHYWCDYIPWKYMSISHLPPIKTIPLYAQPIIFIMVWLSISMLILRKFLSMKLMFTSFFIAWLFLDALFIHKINLNNVWIQSVYAQKEKSLPDNELLTVAKKVIKIIGSENTLPLKNHKIYVFASDQYRGLRLVYHLLPLNAAYLGVKLDGLNFTNGDYVLIYDENRNMKWQNLKALNQDKTVNFKPLSQTGSYQFMRVIK